VISARLHLLATKETQADDKVAGQTPVPGKTGWCEPYLDPPSEGNSSPRGPRIDQPGNCRASQDQRENRRGPPV